MEKEIALTGIAYINPSDVKKRISKARPLLILSTLS